MAHSRSRSSKHSRNDRLRVGAYEPTSSACSASGYTSTTSVTSVPTTSEATEERQQRDILSVSGTPDLPRSETLALRGPGDYVKGTSWATWEYQFNTLMKMRRITNDKDKMFQLVSELGNAVMTELRIVLSEQDGEPSYSSMIQALRTMYGDHDSPLMHRDVLISTRQRDRTFATRSSCLRLSEASTQTGPIKTTAQTSRWPFRPGSRDDRSGDGTSG
ncbi:hypothetical protein L596_029691 [Steinernema carpocapsae]|uniref:Uncharacterized protein n=1 Tax=Steinernema carpocapsae TaxID=34508 RepID=A0A4U5LQI3_STECR|nr:hypothetical protein L596_029691 [Steinernema carpocapsae]